MDTTRHQVAMAKEDVIDIERRPLGKEGLDCIASITHTYIHTRTLEPKHNLPGCYSARKA